MRMKGLMERVVFPFDTLHAADEYASGEPLIASEHRHPHVSEALVKRCRRRHDLDVLDPGMQRHRLHKPGALIEHDPTAHLRETVGYGADQA